MMCGKWSHMDQRCHTTRRLPLSPLLVSIIVLGWSNSVIAQNMIEEDIKQLVAMVEVSPVEGSPRYGAAIIVGAGSDSLYLVTAHHLLHRGIEPKSIQVRFRWLPQQAAPALLMRHEDVGMDISVLRVDNLGGIGARPSALPFERIGAYNALQPNEDLYLIGNPRNLAWKRNVTPEHFVERRNYRMRFEYTSLTSGHSGGALIDKQYRLLGMLTAEDPPYGTATAIDSIDQRMKEWGYPVNLGQQPMPTNFSAISVSGGGRIVAMDSNGTAFFGSNPAEVDTPIPSLRPMRIPGGLKWRSVSSGRDHGCGLTVDNDAYCWGINHGGELGNGIKENSVLAPVAVSNGLKFRTLIAGRRRTCGITLDGKVYCWGEIRLGVGWQYFDPKEVSALPPQVSTITATDDPNNLGCDYVLTSGGSLYQLLLRTEGDKEGSPLLSKGTKLHDNLFRSLDKSCALTTEGKVLCRSSKNEFEDCSLSNAIQSKVPFQSLSDPCALDANGRIHCWTDKTWQAEPLTSPISFNSVSAALGRMDPVTGCALTKTGDPYCWGHLTGYEAAEIKFGPVPVLAIDYGPEAAIRTVERLRLEGKFDQALKEIESAYSRYPGNLPVRRMRAELLSDFGRLKEERDWRALIGKDDPRYVYHIVAIMYRRARLFAEAEAVIKEFEKLSNTPEEKEQAIFARAYLDQDRSDFKAAESNYKKVSLSVEYRGAALNNLAYLLAKQNVRLDEALALVRKAIELRPQTGERHSTLALVYERMGNLQEAETELEIAYHSMAPDPDVTERLASLYFKRGNVQGAIARWKDALEDWNRIRPADRDPSRIAATRDKLRQAGEKL